MTFSIFSFELETLANIVRRSARFVDHRAGNGVRVVFANLRFAL
jgi:hypothetical protein